MKDDRDFMNKFDPDQFVTLCYAAAMNVDLWQKVLDDFGQAVGARGSLIVSYDPSRTANTMHSSCLHEVGVDYSTTWWKHDSRIARARSLGLKPGTIYVDAEFFSLDEKASDPFFQDFYLKHGLDDMAAYISTDPHGGGIATISAPREAARGPFEPRDIVMLQRLAPHVTRAFHLAAMFGAARQHVQDLTVGLNTAQVGAVVLDAGTNIAHMNDVAERLITRCFRISNKRALQGLTPQLQSRLQEMLSAALSLDGNTGRYSAILRSVRSSGYLHVEAVPIDNRCTMPAILQPRQGSVLLLVRDAFARSERSIVPHLQEIGLTRAEAHAAMLVGRGRSPRQAAQILSISEQTVRAQMKSFFVKLHIKRQSELAYLIAQIDAKTPSS